MKEPKEQSPAEEAYAEAVPGGRLASRDVTTKVKQKLTEEQIAERGEHLSKLLGEVESKEDELKAIKSRFKATFDRLDEEIGTLRCEIDSGEGEVEIVATEFYLCDIGKAVTRRKDTNEILSERPMSQSELQDDLFNPTGALPPVAGDVNVPDADDEGGEDDE
jgi:hypothetical protein